ncbi:MAG: hypothetical protein LBN98_03080 [Prevotellaceae bacterium]|jgi:hypothetical protein|nr:hypothetical protein [Prevotellaceae bacterium]
MNKYPLWLFLLLVAAPAPAQDTVAVSRPAMKPALLPYFPPLYNNMITKPIKLDFSLDPLLSNDHYNDALTQRNLLFVRNMEQQVARTLREEYRQMQINARIATAAGLFFWGALIEENIRGYINYRQEQHNQPPPPPPAPRRPPELRKP